MLSNDTLLLWKAIAAAVFQVDSPVSVRSHVLVLERSLAVSSSNSCLSHKPDDLSSQCDGKFVLDCANSNPKSVCAMPSPPVASAPQEGIEDAPIAKKISSFQTLVAMVSNCCRMTTLRTKKVKTLRTVIIAFVTIEIY